MGHEVVWGSVGLGLGGATLLQMVYSGVKGAWPLYYAIPSTRIEHSLRVSEMRFVAFRFLPPFIVSILAAVTALRIGLSPVLTMTCMGSLFVARNPVWGLMSEARNGTLTQSRTLFHIASGALSIFGIMMGGVLARWALPMTPDARELVVSLWTASLAALATAWVQTLLRDRSDSKDLWSVAERDVGASLWAEIPHIATRFGAPPDLVLAIVAAEVIQRPRWFRRLERLKGRVFRHGTYGVAQVHASSAISDRESVQRVAESLAGYQVPLDPRGYRDEARLAVRLEAHNPSPAFLSAVNDFLRDRDARVREKSGVVSPDGHWQWEVFSIERIGERVEVTGTCFGHAELLGRTDTCHEVTVRCEPLYGRRFHWVAETSVWARSLEITPKATVAEESLSVALDYL